MRVVILAEGSTERTALEPFLHRAVEGRTRKPVGIKAFQLQGAANLRKNLLDRVRIHLDSSETAGVIGLFDLRSPSELFDANLPSDEDRMDAFATNEEGIVDDDRFRVMFAVPEVEAWLFADPEIFPAKVRETLPERLKRAPENMASKPSEALNDLYRRATGKTYRKTIDGRNLFAKLSPDRVAELCPRFRMLLDAIVELADRANP